MRFGGWSERRRRWGEEPYRRHVANLSVARAISVTGTRAASIAWVAVIFSRSGGSGAWVAALVLTQFATSVLAAPWAGAIGDRFDRRVVMIASDLLSAGVFVAVAFSHSAIQLVALAGVASIVSAPFGPASSAFLVMLVPEAERTRATAARASAVAVGTVLGGALGGVAVAVLGGATAFLLNAASFVISAIFVLGIRGRYRAEPSNDPAHTGIWAGVRFVARHDALRLVLAANGAALLGYGMINVGEFPLFAHLGSGAFGFGIATAGYGVGNFVGARFGRRAEGAFREKQALFFGWLIGGLAIVLCAVSPSSLSVIILFSIAGVGDSAALLAGTLLTQRHTPDPVRARVFAASSSVNTGAMSVAMFVAGFLIGPLGPVALCLVCGVVTLSALLPATLLPPRGQLPWKPDVEPVAEPTRRHRWLFAT
jgi:DHA3 family macrolide efflux protein-like MFS transporter